MPKEKSTKKVPAKVPDHVFIDQGPDSFLRDQSRLVSSQARRYQSADKRQRQRQCASHDAGYARSLVGWRPPSSTPSVESQGRISPIKSKSREQGQTQRRQIVEEEEERQISLVNQTGLRADPFNSFPSSNTKEVMSMVDYRKSLRFTPRNFKITSGTNAG